MVAKPTSDVVELGPGPGRNTVAMIEAFDEIVGDAESVEAMKAWLIQQKRTSRWREARQQMLLVCSWAGDDLLGDIAIEVTVGEEALKPGENGASKVERAPGF